MDKKGNPLMDQNGKPQLKMPNPRVELPYMIIYIFCILFITLLHLSCNKSANFLVLNVYFAEDNHEEKEDKIK